SSSLIGEGGIFHILDIGSLVLLTSNSEWLVRGDASGVITPTEVNAVKVSNYGADFCDPVLLDGNVVFAKRGGRALIDLAFNYEVDNYTGHDLSMFAKHLLKGVRIRGLAFDSETSVIWVRVSEGKSGPWGDDSSSISRNN